MDHQRGRSRPRVRLWKWNAAQSDELVPVDKVPANVMEVARKQLPGFQFETVYKMKVNGKDAFEIRGKNAAGQDARGRSLSHRRSA